MGQVVQPNFKLHVIVGERQESLGEAEQAMTLCARWIYEDDLELQSEISKYCDHGYCHGRGETMSSDGYTMGITIERLPSGNYIMRNERGYLLCEVISGSELAKFVEKHLERGLFTLRVLTPGDTMEIN